MEYLNSEEIENSHSFSLSSSLSSGNSMDGNHSVCSSPSFSPSSPSSQKQVLAWYRKVPFPSTLKGRICLVLFLVIFAFLLNALIIGLYLNSLNDTSFKPSVSVISVSEFTDLDITGVPFEAQFSVLNPIPVTYSLSIDKTAIYWKDEKLASLSLAEEKKVRLPASANVSSTIQSVIFFDPNVIKSLLRHSEKSPQVELKITATLKTMAFWFPVSFSTEISKKIPIGPDSPWKDLVKFSIDTTNISSSNSSIEADIVVNVGYGGQDCPKVYWSDMTDLRVKVSDEASDQVLQVSIPSHSIDPSNSKLGLHLSLVSGNRESIKKWLKNFQKGIDMHLLINLDSSPNNAKSKFIWPKQVGSFPWTMGSTERSFVPDFWNNPNPRPVADIYNISWIDVKMVPHPVFSFEVSLNVWKMFASTPPFNVVAHLPKMFLVAGFQGNDSTASSFTPALSMNVNSHGKDLLDFQKKSPYSFSCKVEILNAPDLLNWIGGKSTSDLVMTGEAGNHLLSDLLSVFSYNLPTYMVPSFVYHGYSKTLQMLGHSTKLDGDFATVKEADWKHYSIAANYNGATVSDDDLTSVGTFSWTEMHVSFELSSYSIPMKVESMVSSGSLTCQKSEEGKGNGSCCLFQPSPINGYLNMEWVSDSPRIDFSNVVASVASPNQTFDIELKVNNRSQNFSFSSESRKPIKGIFNSMVDSGIRHSRRKSSDLVSSPELANYLIKSSQKFLRATIYPISERRSSLLRSLICSFNSSLLLDLGERQFWKDLTRVTRFPSFTKEAIDQKLNEVSEWIEPVMSSWLYLVNWLITQESNLRNEADHLTSFLDPFLKASIESTHRLIGNFNLASVVNVSLADGNVDVSKDMPQIFVQVFEYFFRHYFSSVKQYIKIDVIAAFLDLNETSSKVDTISQMINHSGPMMQKTFQLFADNIKDPDLREKLKSLKDQISPMRQDELDAQLEIAFDSKEKFHKKFPYFNEKSVKAASIGQGHLGKMRVKGELEETIDVFIKILRPNLKEKFAEELEVLMNGAKKYGAVSIMQEYAQGYESEIDFKKELENGQRATNFFPVNDGPIRTVKYLEPLTGKNNQTVGLVMERVNGTSVASVKDVHNATLGCVLQDQLVLLLQSWFMEGMYGQGFFHGDPHGGNIMVSYDINDIARTLNLTMIDMGNAHVVEKSFSKVFLIVGLGIKFRDASLILTGLGYQGPSSSDLTRVVRKQMGFQETPREVVEYAQKLDKDSEECRNPQKDTMSHQACIFLEWKSLEADLVEMFNDKAFLEASIELQFDMGVKRIGNHAKLPFPPKSIDFFRAKTHLEKLIKSIRDKFHLTPDHCKPVDFSVLYFKWGLHKDSFMRLGLWSSLFDANPYRLGKLFLQESINMISQEPVFQRAQNYLKSTLEKLRSIPRILTLSS